MLRWDYKKNTQGIEVVDAGLTARRQAEVALFNS
jgi:GH24 family phage-related lysozyme (muramidase)